MDYGIFYHSVKDEDGEFLSAGLVVKDERGNEIRRIYDVSTDFEAFEKFVCLLGDSKVLPEHLDSMIEDYYSEHY